MCSRNLARTVAMKRILFKSEVSKMILSGLYKEHVDRSYSIKSAKLGDVQKLYWKIQRVQEDTNVMDMIL